MFRKTRRVLNQLLLNIIYYAYHIPTYSCDRTSIVHYTPAPNSSNSNVSMRNHRLLWGEFPNSSVLNWGLIFPVPGFHMKVHSTPCAPFQLSINRGSEFPHGFTKLVRQSHSFLQENRALISASSQGAAATKRSKAHLSLPPLLSLGQAQTNSDRFPRD